MNRNILPKVGLVITTDGAGEILKLFLDYHFDLGFSHAFIFFDRDSDLTENLIGNYPNTTIFKPGKRLNKLRRNQVLYKSMAPHLSHELIARQMLNLETAIDIAIETDLDWLLHIDDDELLFTHRGLTDVFQTLSEEVGEIKFLNHEAVPEGTEIENYFRDVTLFKTNPLLLSAAAAQDRPLWAGGAIRFNGYANGKAAVRLKADVLPLGPHGFSTSKFHPKTVVSGWDATIYHYTNCGLSRFTKKYERLGNFSNYYFNAPNPDLPFGWPDQQQITLDFHLDARNTFALEGQEGLSKIYKSRVQMNQGQTTTDMIQVGLLHRNTSMWARIASLNTSQSDR